MCTCTNCLLVQCICRVVRGVSNSVGLLKPKWSRGSTILAGAKSLTFNNVDNSKAIDTPATELLPEIDSKNKYALFQLNAKKRLLPIYEVACVIR